MIKNVFVYIAFNLFLLTLSFFLSTGTYASVSPSMNINFYFPETMVSENETVNLTINLVNSEGDFVKSLMEAPNTQLQGRFVNKIISELMPDDLTDSGSKFQVVLSERVNNKPDVTQLIPVYSVPYAFVASQVEMPLVINAIHGLKGYLSILVTPNGILDIDAATTNIGGITILNNGSDYAERFYFSNRSKIQPGMVVVIDENASIPGTLKQSTKAYEKTVVGVVSGGNNLQAGTIIGAGDYPVALSGIVWVYCDAKQKSIQPGDWLASSNTPGYAMKSEDLDKGGIICKAMTSLSRGETGLVLMFVSLR